MASTGVDVNECGGYEALLVLVCNKRQLSSLSLFNFIGFFYIKPPFFLSFFFFFLLPVPLGWRTG